MAAATACTGAGTPAAPAWPRARAPRREEARDPAVSRCCPGSAVLALVPVAAEGEEAAPGRTGRGRAASSCLVSGPLAASARPVAARRLAFARVDRAALVARWFGVEEEVGIRVDPAGAAARARVRAAFGVAGALVRSAAAVAVAAAATTVGSRRWSCCWRRSPCAPPAACSGSPWADRPRRNRSPASLPSIVGALHVSKS